MMNNKNKTAWSLWLTITIVSLGLLVSLSLMPGGEIKVAAIERPADEPQVCQNTFTRGNNNCGTGCDVAPFKGLPVKESGGDTLFWNKYTLETITYLGQETRRLSYLGNVWSLGDKWNDGKPTIKAQDCDGNIGGVYAICCDSATRREEVPTTELLGGPLDDGRPPSEAICFASKIPGTSCPKLTFAANPTSTKKPGDPVILSWSSPNINTERCEASDGWVGRKSASGSATVSPTSDTTYALTCFTNNFNGNGVRDYLQSVTVTVGKGPTVEPQPQCNDKIDNDGDKLIDYGSATTNDPGCSSSTDDDEENVVPPTGCSGCLGGFPDCTAACKATFPTAVSGFCAIPESTDPGNCCGCNLAPPSTPVVTTPPTGEGCVTTTVAPSCGTGYVEYDPGGGCGILDPGGVNCGTGCYQCYADGKGAYYTYNGPAFHLFWGIYICWEGTLVGTDCYSDYRLCEIVTKKWVAYNPGNTTTTCPPTTPTFTLPPPSGSSSTSGGSSTSSPPSTCTINASPKLLLYRNQPSTLTWNCEGRSGCAITDDNDNVLNIGSVDSSGSQKIAGINTATTFTLRCSDTNPVPVTVKLFSTFIREVIPQ